MFLYYTGADTVEQAQTQIQRSLGGNKSSTRIPNGALNNLFSNIPAAGKEEIIGVVLKNETGVAVSDVTIFADLPVGSDVQFLVSAVTLNSGVMEQLSNNQSIPYIGSLVDMTGAANTRTLAADLGIGEQIGLWIKIVAPQKIVPSCDQLYASYLANGIPSKEAVTEAATLKIEWS